MSRNITNIDGTARDILEKRYLREGEEPKDMLWRVAQNIGSVEENESVQEYWARIFYKTMHNLDFLPNSPTLMNAGTKNNQLSACFVLDIPDSMEGIFTTLYDMAMIQKSGGGTGFNFGDLRPSGTPVSSTKGNSSGPISFMKVFDAASQEIEQGGARRGANMGCMSVYHPDIEEFIDAKKGTETEFKNFNISVLIDDHFMEAIEEDKTICLTHEKSPHPAKFVNARELFHKICNNIHENGEPGIIFIDEMNRNHPLSQEIKSTNPCAEQPLLPYESCNLGSINLVNMLNESTKTIDWKYLEKTVEIAVRFLDNVIDANEYPLEKIEQTTKKNRKIGLGVMGFASLLIKMGIPYDSHEADKIATQIMKFINEKAHGTSKELGKIKGLPEGCKDLGRRNTTLTTIAPTGSLATIAGVSYGIEPLFALSYRKRMIDKYHTILLPEFKDELDRLDSTGIYKENEKYKILEEVKRTGKCSHINNIPADSAAIFKTSQEIDPTAHVNIQAAFQSHTDNAVSKTINMSSDSTVNDIILSIRRAYTQKCKGITIYRDKSRENEAVITGSKNDTKKEIQTQEKQPAQRPQKVQGFTEMVQTGCGKLYVTVNYVNNKPFEVFVETGSSGGCSAFGEGVSRSVSLALRAGVDVDNIIKQLRKTKCSNFLRKASKNGIQGKSCPDIIGRVLQENKLTETNIEPKEGYSEEVPESECPDCGARLNTAEGCLTCSCGYSVCN